MNKRVKVILLSVLAVGVFIFLGYKFALNYGARDFENEKPEYTVAAANLIQEFSTAPEVSSKKYLNKGIEVTGVISQSGGKLVTLNDIVSCHFQKLNVKSKGQIITVKGIFIGYDDLLGDIKLDQCYLISN
jgi:hypothetical protein